MVRPERRAKTESGTLPSWFNSAKVHGAPQRLFLRLTVGIPVQGVIPATAAESRLSWPPNEARWVIAEMLRNDNYSFPLATIIICQ
jgi:hypothetical protein